MLRLFVSLYLVVIVAIFTINLASEAIWQRLNSHESEQQLNTITLSEQLGKLITDKQQLTQLNNHGLTLQLISTNDIAWLPEQQQQLNLGKAVSLYDLQQRHFIYVKTAINNQLLQIGPFEHDVAPTYLKITILVLSYVLLAVVIALWTRPIWNDLKQLTRLAHAIDNHQELAEEPPKSRSPIAAIVKTVNQMAARIKYLINEQKQLVNAVSHELRTPLSRLRFSFAMLKNIEEEQQQAIEQDIVEIETLIDELLSYSRIEHLCQEKHQSQANISELLNNQIEKHHRTSNITIIGNIPNDIEIRCNGELLERACQNLITNALRYAKHNIAISAGLTAQTLEICVEDDGKGIAPEYWQSLFEPFSRVERSRDKNQGGYGLGLAIVQKACDWHQGKCTISHSNLGGACFTISIPRNE